MLYSTQRPRHNALLCRYLSDKPYARERLVVLETVSQPIAQNTIIPGKAERINAFFYRESRCIFIASYSRDLFIRQIKQKYPFASHSNLRG
jgi:hypothetical protein